MGLFTATKELAGSAVRILVDPFPSPDRMIATARDERGHYAVVGFRNLPVEHRGQQLWFTGFLGSPGHHNWVGGRSAHGPLPQELQNQLVHVLAVMGDARYASAFARQLCGISSG